MPSEKIWKDYTVIVKDYSEHREVGVTHAVEATGHCPESAAGDAECAQAIKVWERRVPECPNPNDVPEGWSMQERDDAWIACMESVSAIAVIEGKPKVYVEDDIYFPDEADPEPWVPRTDGSAGVPDVDDAPDTCALAERGGCDTSTDRYVVCQLCARPVCDFHGDYPSEEAYAEGDWQCHECTPPGRVRP